MGAEHVSRAERGIDVRRALILRGSTTERHRARPKGGDQVARRCDGVVDTAENEWVEPGEGVPLPHEDENVVARFVRHAGHTDHLAILSEPVDQMVRGPSRRREAELRSRQQRVQASREVEAHAQLKRRRAVLPNMARAEAEAAEAALEGV
eukprot:730056-Prymnesium_polylepis.1